MWLLVPELALFFLFFRMAKLRRELRDDNSQHLSPTGRQLRIVASGTLFLTHTLSIPCHPAPSSMIRAHSVDKARGGSANIVCFSFSCSLVEKHLICLSRRYRYCHCWRNSPLWKPFWWHHWVEMRKEGWS